ncbi:MAG: hypothetical protein HS115_09315 [Spirochaetales bacterium]|nr:hypothetical protein [Spirochaetales bacterium]
MKKKSRLLEDLSRRANPEKSRRFDPLRLQAGLMLLMERTAHFKKPPASISIVGSKGKGSSAFFLEYLARKSGLKTGLYTSPHLLDFCERIRINGEAVALSILENTYELIDKKSMADASYFELLTVLALVLFQDVDIMILEAGLGGRLDATRSGRCEHTILTAIEREHTEILGQTQEEIIKEKLAITGSWTRSLYVYSTVPAELLTAGKSALPAEITVHHSDYRRSSNYLDDNFNEIYSFLRKTPGLPEILPGHQAPPLPGRLELRAMVASGKPALFDTAHTKQSVAHILDTPAVQQLPRPLVVAGHLTADRQADDVFEPVAMQGLTLFLLGQPGSLPNTQSFSSEDHFRQALKESRAASLLFLGSHRLYPLFHSLTEDRKTKNPW